MRTPWVDPLVASTMGTPGYFVTRVNEQPRGTTLRAQAEDEERMKVFEEICRNHVASNILTRYVHSVLKVGGSIPMPSRP